MKIEHTREWFRAHRVLFEDKLLEPCVNCGRKSEQLHHIVPLIEGGTNKRSNVIQVCVDCHGKIHGRDFIKMRKLALEGKKRAKATNPNYKEGRPRKFDPKKIEEVLDFIELGHSFKEAAEIYGISKTTLIRRMQERVSKNGGDRGVIG